jgi:hypothetical protein
VKARSLRWLGMFLLTFLCREPVRAQSSVPDNCEVDPETIAVPPCAIRLINGRVQIIPSHLTILGFNKYGLAPAWIQGGWTYVDRHGWVVVQNVAVMDNGANDFHHGLVRVTRGGKWGLADPRGKLVVPLQYDGALDYQPVSGWLVCKGCHTVTGVEGEYHWFEGGEWFRLNTQGKVIGPTKDPTLTAPRPPPPT